MKSFGSITIRLTKMRSRILVSLSEQKLMLTTDKQNILPSGVEGDIWADILGVAVVNSFTRSILLIRNY